MYFDKFFIFVYYFHFRFHGEDDDRMSVASRKMTAYAKTDCVGASKGLFFGLLTLVLGVISLILFFVLIDHDNREVRLSVIKKFCSLCNFCIPFFSRFPNWQSFWRILRTAQFCSCLSWPSFWASSGKFARILAISILLF